MADNSISRRVLRAPGFLPATLQTHLQSSEPPHAGSTGNVRPLLKAAPEAVLSNTYLRDQGLLLIRMMNPKLSEAPRSPAL
ncbi:MULTISPECIES: hypothetical protein [unclassified Novosphingobium]|uniref:hypothetical protein n=1 Tax=unclassified Novosphingobium TaxID=2644732 RepID=UPI001493FA1A|nr:MULTISPECIES: hypothetical protein [unclassified Novosphingobium]MBB3360083.1 hypothetical protein [Novosphingobium sp. BK256]MBB3376428.1 hypothetical protein [Novosphingobium sp. BK280]MBB3380856.1 hypothetical protein [Novosphingobium sp. BK258]MBB3422492.1 hypothetical protein [Novosphingobium sp. BK267]MBB3451207.1 hypothetical protein [Novosphingobium sp. BK352]